MKTAQSWPQPIQVYIEMSSFNPESLMPRRSKTHGEKLVEGFVGSINMDAGQICTNPGLMIAIKGPELDAFIGSGQ